MIKETRKQNENKKTMKFRPAKIRKNNGGKQREATTESTGRNILDKEVKPFTIICVNNVKYIFKLASIRMAIICSTPGGKT